MQIASVLANFSLGDADILRRAMGKKKPEEMAEQRDKFLKGCQDKKILPRKAEKIFDQMAKFAEYGFNKSHSAAYAMISYQTAWPFSGRVPCLASDPRNGEHRQDDRLPPGRARA
jgi:DNA polymerase-3 subunit alpha